MSFRIVFLFVTALLLPPPGQQWTSAGPGSPGPCGDGTAPRTLSFQGDFGPEPGGWPLQQLEVPKFVPPSPGARLIQVDVELCGRAIGEVTATNLDDEPCTFTFQTSLDAQMAPNDPVSPIQAFTMSLLAQGGPINLQPGEQFHDTLDSGLVCAPARTFTMDADLAWFTASPGDESIVFDHMGFASSDFFGCGTIEFSSSTFTTLSARVTYTSCANLPPVCVTGPDYDLLCGPNPQVLKLDAAGSYDPEGQPLSFSWTTTCPNSPIIHPTSPTATILVDTSGCNVDCQADLALSDGIQTETCGISIRIH